MITSGLTSSSHVFLEIKEIREIEKLIVLKEREREKKDT
jgi:hypothetical protein